MSSYRGKRKFQASSQHIREFLAQDILDVVAIKVSHLEHDIISLKEKEEWSTFWKDPAFESMLSEKVSKALATMTPCVSGDSSLISGSDFPEPEDIFVKDIFVSYQEKMNDDIASFRSVCPVKYLNKFDLKVAEFETSLLTSFF